MVALYLFFISKFVHVQDILSSLSRVSVRVHPLFRLVSAVSSEFTWFSCFERVHLLFPRSAVLSLCTSFLVNGKMRLVFELNYVCMIYTFSQMRPLYDLSVVKSTLV